MACGFGEALVHFLLKKDCRRQVVLSGRKVLKKRNFQFLSAAIPRFDRMLLSQRLATFLIMTEFIDSTNRTGIMEAASDYISNHTGILGSGHWRRIFIVFGDIFNVQQNAVVGLEPNVHR